MRQSGVVKVTGIDVLPTRGTGHLRQLTVPLLICRLSQFHHCRTKRRSYRPRLELNQCLCYYYLLSSCTGRPQLFEER